MPTNTPIPGASTGNVIAAATQNDMVPLNTCVGLLGKGAAINGSPPATTAPNFQIQAGFTGVTVTSGIGTITFPTAFPNGLLYFNAIVLDASGNTNNDTITLWNTGGASFITFTLSFNGGNPPNGTYSFSWMAIGF